MLKLASYRSRLFDTAAGGRKSRRSAALWAGLTAGLPMAMALMVWTRFTAGSAWVFPNLVSALWLGDGAAGRRLGGPTLLGLATHLIASGAVGLGSIPFLRDLPVRRKIATATVLGLAAYPLVFGFVLPWAHPLMLQETSVPPMAFAHALFGLVLGGVYVRLRRSVR